jgi:hypothetical protein
MTIVNLRVVNKFHVERKFSKNTEINTSAHAAVIKQLQYFPGVQKLPKVIIYLS